VGGAPIGGLPRLTDQSTRFDLRRHCERSEAIQGHRRRPTIPGLLRRFAPRNDGSARSKPALAAPRGEGWTALGLFRPVRLCLVRSKAYTTSV